MDNDLERILCKHEIALLQGQFIHDGWITVSHYIRHPSYAICSAFANDKQTEDALKHYEWDFRPEDSIPYYYEGEGDDTETRSPYHRFGDGEYEPLVYWRQMQFCDKPCYCEVSQEFLLFHHLHEKQGKATDLWHRKYVYFSETGEEEECVIIDDRNVKIKVRALREYLWARKLNLLVYLERFVYSPKTYDELGVDGTTFNKFISGDDYNYIYSQFLPNGSDKSKSGANICGKCVIRFKTPKHSSEKQYEEFIIGTDDEGDDVLSTCEQRKLPNYLGANLGAYHFMSPVYFRGEVLDKYYAYPQKYHVRDGYVSCEGFWGLHIDNNNPDYVVVFLYKLGEIPHKEQKYWRLYNISRPPTAGLSITSFTRNICGHFCDPVSPDLKFKQEFERFSQLWNTKMGWPLFLPLTPEDADRERTLHSLTEENSRQEFEDQILSLTKLTIDSLNQEGLSNNTDHNGSTVAEFLKKKVGKPIMGMDKFEMFLLHKGIEASEIMSFFRNVYNLRSSDVAHRKSSNPKNRKKFDEYFKLDTKSKREVLDWIFLQFIRILDQLARSFGLSGSFQNPSKNASAIHAE